ncbi:MYO1H protein, partial [Ramphastos sulfuratus]|nr:MYO1H protein [Ramphastos sulfuratus]
SVSLLLFQVLCNSKNGIVRECFLLSELDNRRRPETVATQFKNSLTSLIEILMSKEPSYVRCIKPNELKEPGRFDDFLIRHQVKYLGLMEHLRVRRAGFAYRRKYEIFLQRALSLARAAEVMGISCLWPFSFRTKIFIRFPKTLFATEDAFELRKYLLGMVPLPLVYIETKKQSLGEPVGSRFVQQMQCAIKLEACWRGVLARKAAKKRTWAVQIIRKFIKGFINRKKPLCPENAEFVRLVQYNYLMKLREHLPKNVLDKSWLQPPSIL